MFFVNLFVYITMVNKYSQKLLKEVRERFQNLIKEEKKKKGEKRPEKDIKIFLNKKKKISVSIIMK